MLISAILLAGLPAAPQVSFEDKLLLTVPDGVEAGDFSFSPDGRLAACRARAGGKAFVMVNREKGPEFLQITDPPRFGPDGRTVLYRAEGAKSCVVVGARPEPWFDHVGVPVFSPDGRKVAYSACSGGTWLVVVGGARHGAGLHWAGTPLFNSNGGSWAVPVRVAKDASGKIIASGVGSRTKEFMLVDGKPGPEFDKIEDPVFAPSGSALAYRARMGIDVGVEERWFMVAGNKRGEAFSFLGPPRYAQDGRLVYVAGSGGKYWVVVDGQKSEEYENVTALVIGPGGRSIAYVAWKEGKSFIVLDGRRVGEYAGVGEPVFSPDGRKLAFPAGRVYKWMMVAGDKGGDLFDFVGPPVWSPDSREVAYSALWNNFTIMVVAGARTELFEAVGTPAWSPDGHKVAHWARKEGKVYMVVSHARSDETYDEVLTVPVFSPDSRKVAFGARKGRDLIWRVLAVKG